jgi:maltose alpha-D-glucosyltransferase/alpha-amylase
VSAVKTRLHGDFHLAQALIVGSDVLIVDLEGEPARPLEARRAKQSPLRDVAGMLRSLDYAHHAALLRATAERPTDLPVLEPFARAWLAVSRSAFLEGYRAAIEGCPAWPAEAGDAERLITLFGLEKALYEVRYELANRPDWAAIPLEGLLGLLAPTTTGDAIP